MEVSENNGTEGSSDKEESSYNLAVETFVEPANDQVVPPPPPPPLLGSVYMTPYHSTSSEVRPKTHAQPLSEQLNLTHDIHIVPQQVASRSSEIERHSLNTGSSNSHGRMQETHSIGPRTHTQPLSEQLGLTHDMHLVPQQVVSGSSYSSEIGRHSLNTGSSNSHGGMQETHSSTSNPSIISSEISSNSPSVDTNANSSRHHQQYFTFVVATGNFPRPKGGAKGSAAFPDNSRSTEDLECDSPAQNSDPIDLLCFRCEKEHKDTTLLPCEELCVCRNCAEFLKATEGPCPSCGSCVDNFFTSKLPTKIKSYY